MNAIELCLQGDLYFFEHQLTDAQIETLSVYTLEYCANSDLNCFNADAFISAVENNLHLVIKPIRVSRVIAV